MGDRGAASTAPVRRHGAEEIERGGMMDGTLMRARVKPENRDQVVDMMARGST
jgi:hypothetical protein